LSDDALQSASGQLVVPLFIGTGTVVVRSPPNRDLYLSDEDVGLKPPIYLGSVRRLEKQRQRLGQMGTSLFDRVTLAGDVELWAKGDVAVSLPFDNGCEPPKHGLA
jgi:hypothetical protein